MARAVVSLLVLNGPNLNRLGQRPAGIYGSQTLATLEGALRAEAEELGIRIDCRQSNEEGQLLDWLHSAGDDGFVAVIINPGGLAHTSVVLRDAISECGLPVCEVHISNVHAREDFRRLCLTATACQGVISGLGLHGYVAAMRWLVQELNTLNESEGQAHG